MHCLRARRSLRCDCPLITEMTIIGLGADAFALGLVDGIVTHASAGMR